MEVRQQVIGAFERDYPATTLAGDADGSGTLDTADLVVLIDQILGNATAPGTPDCTNDGSVDVRDLVCLNTRIESGETQLATEIATRFIYGQGGELLAETDATGAVLREYIYLNGAPLAVLDSSGVHYLHTDHLGTPRAVTDQTGRLVWTWIADPFGTTAANDDPDGDGATFTLNLRFPGQYFDTETGLHYNYFRYYDPATGRYVTSDPIGLAGGLNTYGYVGGDPVGGVDFLGLATIVEDSRTWCFRNPVVCKELYDALPGINPPIPIHATPENGLDIDTSLSDDAQEALDIDADVGCPPNGKDPCKGLRKQLKEHQRKLRQYSKDPLSMDNRGDLRRAIQDGDMARAQIIFDKRVIKLTKQINNFLNQLILCELRHGIR